MKRLITLLRWIARITSTLAILLFILLFLEDGGPIFLFGSGDPALAFHMWALLAMLIGLGLGWKWEGLSAALTLGFFVADEIALLLYSLGMGIPESFSLPLAAFSFPFIILPLGGLLYLICWIWTRRNRKSAA